VAVGASKLIFPAVVIGGLAFWIVRTHRGATQTNGASATASASSRGGPSDAGLPLLDNLKAGDMLDDWLIERVAVTEAPNKTPELAIELGRLGSGITIWIHRKGSVSNAPVETERYALTYGHPRAEGAAIPNDAYQKMMSKVAEMVRRNERVAPVPTGL
jgi:hypothetical protein